MSSYRLNLELPLFVHVTPAGAYHALVAGLGSTDISSRLLQRLLQLPETPLLGDEVLSLIDRIDSAQGKLELLYHLQELDCLRGEEIRLKSPELNMEREVPLLLKRISSQGRGVLADAQGLVIASVGFAYEAVEELAGLASASLALQKRFSPLLNDNLRYERGGWGILDASANGMLGIWPLHLGQQVIAMVIAGQPYFNSAAFLDLAWWLMRRYG